MTLDEAIIHCEELADGHDRIKQIKAVTLEECKCAYEHRQLAEWLKELKAYKEQTDGDLISRKQAEECCLNGWNKDYKDILEDIRKLPSAEKTDGDLISLDFMKKLGATCIAKRSETGELVAISSIDNLPSAEKTAEWKPLDKEKAQYYMFGYVCSKCGAPAKSPTKYCSNCGAKMHGGNPG